jgi:hypothetical protein
MHMSSNGGGLCIFKECKVPGYDFWVWFTKRAMTNILCLKNLIRMYRVTYDSERQTCSHFLIPMLSSRRVWGP